MVFGAEEGSAAPAAEPATASEGAPERQPEPSSAAGPATAATNGATGVSGAELTCILPFLGGNLHAPGSCMGCALQQAA